MHFKDAFTTATRGIRHAKARSLLTMLGIVIGITSVVLLMSLGSSAQKLIISQVRDIGSNLIFIVPGATKGSRMSSPPSVQGVIIKTLIKEDADALSREIAIERVAPEVRGQGRVVYENNDTTVTYEGTNPDFFTMRNFKTDKGALFTSSDVDSMNRVAVLGPTIAETLFGTQDPIGKTVRLKNLSFQVVGVLESKGIGPFGIDQDSLVLVPLTVAQKQLLGIDFYNVITLQARDEYDTDFITGRVTSVLRQNHGITDPDKDDFTIRTQQDALSLLGNITSILTIFLTAIAAVSLVVGGIGIMNTMLISVTERTREIGLRKALGAKNKDILQQFLLESILITLIGGIIGIASGAFLVTAAWLILKQVVPGGWVFSLPVVSLILAAGVSIITGVVFGLYPAQKAARKSPVEALRYE